MLKFGLAEMAGNDLLALMFFFLSWENLESSFSYISYLLLVR